MARNHYLILDEDGKVVEKIVRTGPPPEDQTTEMVADARDYEIGEIY